MDNNNLPTFDPATFVPFGGASAIPQTPSATAPTPATTATTAPASASGLLPTFDPATFVPLGGRTETQKQISTGNASPSLLSAAAWSLDQPLTSYGAATRAGIGGLVKDTYNAAKGAVTGTLDLFSAPKDDTEKTIAAISPVALPLYRTLRGAGHSVKDAAQITGAIHDINNSADPVGTYAKVAQQTASQGAGQALTALAAEGIIKTVPKVAEGVGAVYKNTKGLISTKPLQEPLQAGVRDTINDAVADTKAQIAANPPKVDAYPVKLVRSPEGDVLDLDGRHRVMQAIERGDPRISVQTTLRDGSVTNLQVDPKMVAKEFGVTKESLQATDVNQPYRANGPRKPVLVPKEGAAQNIIENAERTPAKPASKSIRQVAEQAGDNVNAAAKADYQALDEATGGRFQRFKEKLDAGRKQLRNLSGSEEDVQKEASILKGQKETEDAMQEAFADAKAKGVDPQLVDRANANFKKSQALYDLDNAIKKSTTGAHPDVSTTELQKEYPETLDPRGFHRRIEALYNSGRLEDALGERGANTLFDHTLEHSGAYNKILRNQKWAKYAAGAVGARELYHYTLGGRLTPSPQ